MSFSIAEPRFRARAVVSVLGASTCRSSLAAYRELSSRPSAKGSVLMESAATGSPGGTRSLVVPAGAVRLTLCRGEAVFDALSPEAKRLLPGLSHIKHLPTGPGKPDDDDAERLRAPAVLDAVRALANLVEDEEPGAALPPGIYGAFSYELVDQWEDLPPRPPDPWNEPDINVVPALDTILLRSPRRDRRARHSILGAFRGHGSSRTAPELPRSPAGKALAGDGAHASGYGQGCGAGCRRRRLQDFGEEVPPSYR